MMEKKLLNQIVRIQKTHFRKAFGKGMSDQQCRELAEKLRKAYNENQFIYRQDEKGKLIYFFQYQLSIMQEFNEQFFHVPLFWSRETAGARKKLLSEIGKEARKNKKEKKIKRMLITVSADETHWIESFKKSGKLTYIELVGKTDESIVRLKKLLKKETKPKGFSFSRLKASDVPALVKLDIESHLKDPSSRMRDIFLKPIGKKLMKNFYRNLVKSGKCFVLRKDGKMAGSIAWFIDQKNHYGLVASIFVAENFKGQGLSKVMYLKLLEEFKRKKCPYYIGSSTTENVLLLAKKIKRKPMNYSFIVRISML